MNCFPQPGQSHAWGLTPVWMRTARLDGKDLGTTRLTVACQIASSSKALATGSAVEGLGWRVSGPPGRTVGHLRAVWITARGEGILQHGHGVVGGWLGVSNLLGVRHLTERRMGGIREDGVIRGVGSGIGFDPGLGWRIHLGGHQLWRELRICSHDGG